MLLYDKSKRGEEGGKDGDGKPKVSRFQSIKIYCMSRIISGDASSVKRACAKVPFPFSVFVGSHTVYREPEKFLESMTNAL